MLKLRAKTLETAIQRLLANENSATEFFDLPLIKSLTQKDEAKPAYLSSSTFVDAIVAFVKAKAAKGSPPLDEATLKQISLDPEKLRNAVDAMKDVNLKPILQTLLSGAKDMAESRQKIESWFNEGMDRATGWYKKRTNIFMAVWALLVVVAFDVDTFTVARTLLNNSKLRTSLVAAAEQTVKEPANTGGNTNAQQTIGEIEKKINGLELPIGWPHGTNAVEHAADFCLFKFISLRQGETWAMKFGGLLVTAFALSFGAPFWFDLLNKFVNLRAAGKKPEAGQETTTAGKG
jgi:hypothetical protein